MPIITRNLLEVLEGQKTQCSQEKGQKDKQRSTKHYTKWSL